MEALLTALWIAVPALVLLSAAASDVRTREVPDVHWAVMGIAGTVLCAMACAGSAGAAPVLCHTAMSLLLLAYMLSERLSGLRALPVIVPAAVLAVIPAAVTDSGFSYASLASFVMFLLFAGMYRAGLLRGGADAKCLMTVALAFPVIPEVGPVPVLWDVPYPESLVLNPSVSVLVVSLALSLLACVPVAVRNIRDGRVGIRMFSSYGMGVEEARGKFVWPVERESGGRKVRCGTCYDKEEALDGLARLGEERVDVTPMVPFVLPALAAFLVVTILGSPLAFLFSV